MSDSVENNTEASSERTNASASSLEDDQLIANALKGKEAAFNKLVNKYQRALYFHIRKMIKENEQVEDLVQETFVKAFDNLHRYNTNYAFSTWLYRIATNHTIDYLRKKKLQTLSIDQPLTESDDDRYIQLEDEEAAADQSVIRKQRHNMIQDAIDSLPKKYRRVIELRHMQEKSYQEIAKVLDLPLGTVKAHIFRARELLYKELKDKKEKF